MKSLAVWLIAAGALIQSTPAHAVDGSNLLTSCESFLQNYQEYGGDQILIGPDVDSGFCWGSMMMLQGLGNVKFIGEDHPALYVCAPDEVRTTQYVRIVVNYLQDHPERLHEKGANLALSALIDAYPCTD